MKSLLLSLSLAAACLNASAQLLPAPAQRTATPVSVAVDPAGRCTNTALVEFNYIDNTAWQCVVVKPVLSTTGVWTQLSGSGGGGVTPNLTFTPTATVTFPATTYATASSPLPVTVTNAALAYFAISSVSITGTNAGDFTETNTCGASIPSGNNCAVTVTFTPTVTGAGISWSESAMLNVIGASTFSEALTGTGQVLNGGLVVTAASPLALSSQAIVITANRPVVFTSPITGTLTTTDNMHSTYTAPSHIAMASQSYGCPNGLIDGVLNSKIDNLPVSSESAAWLTQISAYPLTDQSSWAPNVYTSAPTMETLKFYYGAPSGSYPVHSYPFIREGGQMRGHDGADHHTQDVVTTNCQFYEVYNRGISPTFTESCQDGTTGCIATSGNTYTPATYTIPGQTTDAAGLPLFLSITLTEIKTNTIHHPQRFTLAGGFVSPNVEWPATGNYVFASPSNGIPYGARLRLKSSFVTTSFSTYAQNILNAFKTYGIINADAGTSGGVQMAADVTLDPIVFAAVLEAEGALHISDFEGVDQSSLKLNAGSYQVNPRNNYEPPPVSAYMVATDAFVQSDGNKYSVAIPMPLEGVGVGLSYPQMVVVPGSYTYQLLSYVTGSTNQSVTWALTSGLGSVTTGGVYTPPSTLSGTALSPVVLTATAAADSSAVATQWINLIPVSSDGAIRIVGQNVSIADPTATIVDGNSFTWQGEPGMLSGGFNNYYMADQAWPALVGAPEATVYQRSAHTYGQDVRFRFVMPNGHYRVRWLEGKTHTAYSVCGPVNPVYESPFFFGTADQITAHGWKLGAQTTPPYTTCLPFDSNMPANVTANVFDLWEGGVLSDTDTSGQDPSVDMIGFQIIPDATAAHITIDTGLEAQTFATLTNITPPLVVHANTTAQLYGIGWYMANTVTWTCTGGGSINASTGLYTAPTSFPGSPLTITVTATSTVDGTKTATATLTIPTT
jgi:hypothetical protein